MAYITALPIVVTLEVAKIKLIVNIPDASNKTGIAGLSIKSENIYEKHSNCL
jgi:hypothetical protein